MAILMAKKQAGVGESTVRMLKGCFLGRCLEIHILSIFCFVFVSGTLMSPLDEKK